MTDTQHTPAVKSDTTRGEQYAAIASGTTGCDRSTNYTSGTYETERDAEAALDAALESSGLFRIYKEVRGYHLQPRLGQDHVAPRVDRLLLPLAEITAGGWTHGAIAIECKRTMEKIGRPLSQMMDYTRSALFIPGSGVAVIPSYVFLFPYDGDGGPIQSIVSQQHLGWIHLHGQKLHFATGGCTGLGSVGPRAGEFNVKAVVHGKKAGSR